jgi:predicted small lipoprotein YifL
MKKLESRIPPRILNSQFVILHFVALLAAGCGRKGPPLAPIVRVPAAPADFAAERRGNTVEITFKVPSTNTDDTRPANIERVDVYAYTGPETPSAADLVRRGSRIGTIDVKAPRDPNKTIDPDEPASDLEPLTGAGIDQGVVTELFEELTGDMLRPVNADAATASAPIEDGRPLLGPTPTAASRSYAAVGISTSGRAGSPSKPVAVPLVPAPETPAQSSIRYDENAVTVTWPSRGGAVIEPAISGDQVAGEGTVLASRPLGSSAPAMGFHVYEVGSERFETRLTTDPLNVNRFEDRRIEWGAHRCYTVRSVRTLGALSVESEPAPPACETLVDRFAPTAPKGLVAVPSESAISLIWDPATEKDWAGYLVLRRPAASGELSPVTPEPIQETTFTDKVAPGAAFIYAIQAVDKAGNKSAPSAESTPEVAR